MIRRALETPALYALGAVATLIAVVVGTILTLIIDFPTYGPEKLGAIVSHQHPDHD